MSQVNDNQSTHGREPDEVCATVLEDEIREQRVQEGNLRLLGSLIFVVVPVALAIGYLLYGGHELPPWSMRYNQPADSTGYQPPPTQQVAVSGVVPRTGLPHAFEDTADGSVPAAAQRTRNPLAADAKVLQAGRVVYAENCSFCHGAHGLGDGPAGESYIPHPPDLTNLKARALSEGAIYYLITNGILSTPIPEARKYLPREWHSFRGTISERDRWAVVAFTKSLPEDDAGGPSVSQ